MDDDQTSGETSGKAERDPAEETGEQGVPAGQDQGQGQDAAPTETDAEPAPAVQPPAMTPLQVAAAGPAAAVRVHCDASCGQEWCLYAGPDIPADEDGEPYADPREAVMAAAGCHADPPTCPGATDTTRPTAPTPGASATSPDARAAVLAVANTPDLAALSSPSAATHTVRGPMTLPGRLAAARAEAGLAAPNQAVGEPLMLTTADVHGITSAGVDPSVAQVAAVPYAVGSEVLGMLRELGVATAGLEEVLVQRTPDPELDGAGDPDGEPGGDPGRLTRDRPRRSVTARHPAWVASRADGGTHRAPTSARPPKPVKTGPRRGGASWFRRDRLTPQAAEAAYWYVRWCCALTNVSYGLGFILGAPTGSSTYQAMETVAPMWFWGSLLVVFGPLLLLGRIALGAPVVAVVWLCFAVFNAGSTAWGVPVFALPAAIHCGSMWFILRGRVSRVSQVSR